MAKSKSDVWAETLAILTANNVKEPVIASLRELLEPKAGGAKIDVEEVVHRDEAGTITEIQCSLSGTFLPATTDYFYEDKSGDGIGGTGLKRLSIQAEKARKEHAKQVKASKDGIKADLYAGDIDVETAKQLEANLPGVDYSTVGLIVPEPEEA